MPAAAPPPVIEVVQPVALRRETATAPSDCVRLTRRLPRHASLTSADFIPTPCVAGNMPVAYRYDRRTGLLQAARDLAEGETTRAPSTFAVADVRPGQRVFLWARVGPVSVEREVEAVQAARQGQRLFVKGGDGKVFTARAGEWRP